MRFAKLVFHLENPMFMIQHSIDLVLDEDSYIMLVGLSS